MAVAADPWHPKDAVVRVFEGCDNHRGRGGFIVEGDRDFKGGGAGGSVKSRDGAVGWSCMLQQPQTAGVGVTQNVVGGARVNEE